MPRIDVALIAWDSRHTNMLCGPWQVTTARFDRIVSSVVQGSHLMAAHFF